MYVEDDIEGFVRKDLSEVLDMSRTDIDKYILSEKNLITSKNKIFILTLQT